MKNGSKLSTIKTKLHIENEYFTKIKYARTMFSLLVIISIVLLFLISGNSQLISFKNLNHINNAATTTKTIKNVKLKNNDPSAVANPVSTTTVLTAQSQAPAPTAQMNTIHTQAPIDTAKVPASKVTAPLSINPSSITLYKNVTGAAGFKAGVTQASITISDAAGKALEYPNSDPSSGITLTSTNFGSFVTWNMIATAEYATVGSTVNVPITATASDGSVTYNGTLAVKVLAMPTFSISTAQLYALNSDGSSNFSCGNVNPIAYSSGFDSIYNPAISITTSNEYSFSYDGFVGNSINLSSSSPIHNGQAVDVNILVQNQFQLLSIPCRITTN
jgi:hypothetical protein